MLRIPRDEIGWNRELIMWTQRGSELREGGSLKEAADISLESSLPHTFDNGDSEQGVAAELKEVVEPADAIDVQQFLP